MPSFISNNIFYFSICCFGLFIVHVSCSCMLEVLVSIGTFFGSYHTDVESLLWIVAMVLKNHLWIKTPYPKLAKKPVEILDRLKFVPNLLFSKRLSLNYFFFELSNFYLKMRHFSKSILNMLRIWMWPPLNYAKHLQIVELRITKLINCLSTMRDC